MSSRVCKMGKTDKNQAKLQFDSRKSHSPAGNLVEPGSERGPDMPSGEEQDLCQILVAMQHSLTQHDGKIDSLSYCMDRMTERLDKHAERLDQSEKRVSEVEDGQTRHVKLYKEVHSLRLKVDDLEARSWRNYLRIVGVAESTAIDNMEGFIERLLVQLLGRTTFSDLFVVERAHRSLATHPTPGAPPCPIIERLLNYRDRDTALRRARKLFFYRSQETRSICKTQGGRGRLQVLERDLAQLEQDHQNAAASQTLGQIYAKLLEFHGTALAEVQHLGKYANAQMYGEGERPSSVLANLIRPNREQNVIIAVQAADGSEIRGLEHILARLREYYQSLYASRVTPDHEALLENLTHINMPHLTDEDRDILKALLMLEEMDGAPREWWRVRPRALMG
ncbi:hypothetical protein NDU88_001850 [Pleurodeles waltl]|uniref:Uncharacterized protein n=1 Tax=Pleurodeles waltl TaxID=8319 RepID=A0AAV7PDP2_PLEWA|nr:hypothetical protein NDU88_001850 [Pleurodeles waltl]